MSQSLVTACGLLELDTRGNRLSWCFPSLDAPIDELAARAGLGDRLLEPTFSWACIGGRWHYFLARERATPDVVHATVTRFAIVTVSTIFNPEAQRALLLLMLRAFEAEQGSPLALLQRFLSTTTKGSAQLEGVPDFVARKYDAAAAAFQVPSGAALHELGPDETAALWAACESTSPASKASLAAHLASDEA